MDYKRLSKTISRALRHDPAAYGMELDVEGWVQVDDLLAALRCRHRDWRELDEVDLEKMMERAEKQRYEIQDGKIRAYYGHSVPEKIEKSSAEPPSVLFHGTAPETAYHPARGSETDEPPVRPSVSR
jgi:putative RNA 2'-phosphotransferase